MSVEEVMAVVDDNGFNVTLTGGDPMYQVDEILPLCKALRDAGYNIWLYTGFTIEEIRADAGLAQILDAVDTIVDGPFIEALRDTSLLFRGSSNQRIIKL